MELTLQQLRMLRAVAVAGTIASAADALGYTPSAVSQQLSAVERQSGIAVLERLGRSVTLTDAGRELVRHAEIILAQVEQARASIEQIQGEVAGVLRIGVMESVVDSLLPTILARLARDHPRLELRTVQSESIEAVRNGELDLSFFMDFDLQINAADDTITRALVCRDAYRAVVRHDFAWARPVISLEQLAAFKLVCSPPNRACGQSLRMSFAQRRLHPDIAHQITDYRTIMHVVNASGAVGLIPDLGLWNRLPGLRVLDLDPPIYRTLELGYRRSSEARPAIGAFIDAVDQTVIEFGLDQSCPSPAESLATP